MERYTNDKQNEIIREYFINHKSMLKIAKEQGVTVGKVREIKEKGLLRLRMGKARRELLERFDIVEAGIFRGSLNKYRERGFTSVVEFMVLKREEAKEEYERRLKELEESKSRERGR